MRWPSHSRIYAHSNLLDCVEMLTDRLPGGKEPLGSLIRQKIEEYSLRAEFLLLEQKHKQLAAFARVPFSPASAAAAKGGPIDPAVASLQARLANIEGGVGGGDPTSSGDWLSTVQARLSSLKTRGAGAGSSPAAAASVGPLLFEDKSEQEQIEEIMLAAKLGVLRISDEEEDKPKPRRAKNKGPAATASVKSRPTDPSHSSDSGSGSDSLSDSMEDEHGNPADYASYKKRQDDRKANYLAMLEKKKAFRQKRKPS